MGHGQPRRARGAQQRAAPCCGGRAGRAPAARRRSARRRPGQSGPSGPAWEGGECGSARQCVVAAAGQRWDPAFKAAFAHPAQPQFDVPASWFASLSCPRKSASQREFRWCRRPPWLRWCLIGREQRRPARSVQGQCPGPVSDTNAALYHLLDVRIARVLIDCTAGQAASCGQAPLEHHCRRVCRRCCRWRPGVARSATAHAATHYSHLYGLGEAHRASDGRRLVGCSELRRQGLLGCFADDHGCCELRSQGSVFVWRATPPCWQQRRVTQDR